MGLLFLNAFKGLKKKKIQMFGIVVMVMLSTAVYVGMNSAIDRLENKYYDYLEEQNVEDLSVSVDVDYSEVSKEDINYLLENQLSSITDDERNIINSYVCALDMDTCLIEFISNPFDSLEFEYTLDTIFTKYGAKEYLQSKVLDSIQEKYDFTYELEKSKTSKEGDTLLKVLPFATDGINQTYLVEGREPEEDNEIAILPGYAKTHNIKIGDFMEIGDATYEVVGFAYAPDYIYPLISFSMPIFDENKNNIVHMTENAFHSFNGIRDNVFSLVYNFDVPRKFEISVSTSEEDDTTETTDPFMAIFEDGRIFMDVNTVTRIGRISALQLEFASDRLFAEYFLYLLLAVSVVIIVIITKKRIDDERLQIGVLKSLGYNRLSIATSYLVYPIFGSLIGGVLGFMIGIFVHRPIANMLVSYYCVPLDHFQISFGYLKTSIFVPMCMLSILSYLIALFMLRKKPLSLLKEGSNLKVNIFSRICNKLTSFLPFQSRFKYSLAFRSLGKLLIVTLTSFCTGLLIVLTLIGMNLFNKVIDESFAGIDYKYMVSVSGPMNEEIGDTSLTDYVLSASLPLSKIIDKNGVEKPIAKEDVSFSFTGVDQDAKFVRILNTKEKELNSLLIEDNCMVVNENAKELLGLEIGDELTFSHESIEFTYQIVGFSSEYMGYGAYVDRDTLSASLGFSNSIYTSMYSNDDMYQNLDKLSKEDATKIANVLSVEDLKQNIAKQMDRFNGSIYLVVAFASLMALIIIAVIANIVVEENKKTISLMKVMGYKDKKISSIILNIYTPFIIVAYLLSIPVMIQILKMIVKALVGDIEMTIPITITPMQIIIGLVGLLIAYYIAIALSKRVLKRVPLSIALKRE